MPFGGQRVCRVGCAGWQFRDRSARTLSAPRAAAWSPENVTGRAEPRAARQPERGPAADWGGITRERHDCPSSVPCGVTSAWARRRAEARSVMLWGCSAAL